MHLFLIILGTEVASGGIWNQLCWIFWDGTSRWKCSFSRVNLPATVTSEQTENYFRSFTFFFKYIWKKLKDINLKIVLIKKKYNSLILMTAHYDKCVINLREQYKPDMTPVLEGIFSHAQVSKKNVLVTMLIVRSFLKYLTVLIYFIKLWLCKLIQLNHYENSNRMFK